MCKIFCFKLKIFYVYQIIQLSKSNSSRVRLKSVNFNTTATFRCEVSADEPDFQTIQRRANMTVIRKYMMLSWRGSVSQCFALPCYPFFMIMISSSPPFFSIFIHFLSFQFGTDSLARFPLDVVQLEYSTQSCHVLTLKSRRSVREVIAVSLGLPESPTPSCSLNGPYFINSENEGAEKKRYVTIRLK